MLTFGGDPALLASSATILCDALGSFPFTLRTRFLGGARSCLLEDAFFRALKDTPHSVLARVDERDKFCNILVVAQLIHGLTWAKISCTNYQTITNSAPFRFLPCVLIVRVEGGVVAGGLRGQVERRGRRHRLPPGHCRSLSLHFIALETYNFH